MRFYSDAKKILHLTMPLLSSRLMNLVVFFGGFVMVAKLGENEFAASALANSIFITIILIGVGILYAVGIKMSHAYGAEDHEKIREYLYSGTLLSILLSVLAVAFVLALSFLLPYLGQKPELIPYAKTFMYSMCLPILPAMLSVVANQLVTALLKPRIIFASSVINVPISLFALYAFIFGRFGFPKLGIWGFGWAIAIGDIFLVVVPVLFVMTSRYFKTFNLWHLENLRHYLWKRMMEIVKLGVPMGVQFGAEVAAFAVITFFVGRFGVSALSAFQIAQQIIVVALMIPLTTSEATAILVGQALGRKDPDSMRSIGFSSIILVVLFLLIASIIFYIFPRLLISIYIDVKNPALASIVSLGTLFLYFSAFTQLFDGIRNVITGALRGLHDSSYPMYVGILVMWLVAIPLGAGLAFPLHTGPVGFLIAEGIAFFIGAAMLTWRFHKKTKKKSATDKAP